MTVDETFAEEPNGEGRLLRQSHKRAKTIAKIWIDIGGRLEYQTDEYGLAGPCGCRSIGRAVH